MQTAALVLTWAGVVIAVAASIAAAFTRDFYRRMHFLTPVTTVAAPVIGLGLALHSNSGLAAAQYVLIVVLLAVTGPALAAATGRVAAQQEGRVERDSPE